MDILNTGLGGFFSLAMDSWAFSGELVCFAPPWGRGNNLKGICLSALWQIRPCILQDAELQIYTSSSGCRNDSALVGGLGDGILICLRSSDATTWCLKLRCSAYWHSRPKIERNKCLLYHKPLRLCYCLLHKKSWLRHLAPKSLLQSHFLSLPLSPNEAKGRHRI
jgi:hypothetical protein